MRTPITATILVVGALLLTGCAKEPSTHVVTGKDSPTRSVTATPSPAPTAHGGPAPTAAPSNGGAAGDSDAVPYTPPAMDDSGTSSQAQPHVPPADDGSWTPSDPEPYVPPTVEAPAGTPPPPPITWTAAQVSEHATEAYNRGAAVAGGTVRCSQGLAITLDGNQVEATGCQVSGGDWPSGAIRFAVQYIPNPLGPADLGISVWQGNVGDDTRLRFYMERA